MFVEPPSMVCGLKVGILGGSFNPAHAGHLDITDAARRALGLDRVWWLVSPGNPLKDPDDYISLSDRLAHAEEITQGRPWLRVSGIEADLGSPYTVDTLAFLTRRYRGTDFVWLMGADSLVHFHRWVRWQQIANLAPICVISRPGENMPALRGKAARHLGRYRLAARQARGIARARPPAWVFLPAVHNPISATALRRDAEGV